MQQDLRIAVLAVVQKSREIGILRATGTRTRQMEHACAPFLAVTLVGEPDQGRRRDDGQEEDDRRR